MEANIAAKRFKDEVDIHENRDYRKCYALLDHSLTATETAVRARKDAGVIFAADKE